MWVGILENKNVGYKSICMPGKINNGLLNDMKNELFQTYVYSPDFPNLKIFEKSSVKPIIGEGI